MRQFHVAWSCAVAFALVSLALGAGGIMGCVPPMVVPAVAAAPQSLSKLVWSVDATVLGDFAVVRDSTYSRALARALVQAGYRVAEEGGRHDVTAKVTIAMAALTSQRTVASVEVIASDSVLFDVAVATEPGAPNVADYPDILAALAVNAIDGSPSIAAFASAHLPSQDRNIDGDAQAALKAKVFGSTNPDPNDVLLLRSLCRGKDDACVKQCNAILASPSAPAPTVTHPQQAAAPPPPSPFEVVQRQVEAERRMKAEQLAREQAAAEAAGPGGHAYASGDFKTACGVQYKDSCAILGLKSGCDSGASDGCHKMGLLYWNGYGPIPADEQRGLGYFTRACSLNPSLCTGLGIVVMSGLAPQASTEPKIQSFFNRACSLDAHTCAQACVAYEEMFVQQANIASALPPEMRVHIKPFPADVFKVRKVYALDCYKRACSAGSGSACSLVTQGGTSYGLQP